MISGKQILWGTLGWAFGGPIGGILGVIFAGTSEQNMLDSPRTVSYGSDVILIETSPKAYRIKNATRNSHSAW